VFCFHCHVQMKIRNEQGNPKTLYVWVRLFNWAISYYQPFVGFFMLGQGFFSSPCAQTACEEPTLASPLTGARCYFSGVQRQERDANCWRPYWPSTKIIMLKKCFHFPCSYTVCLFRKGAAFPLYCRQRTLFTDWWIRNSHFIRFK